ncbi:MAG: N-6 DNA methylase [Pseudomonadota bacterium]
MSEADVCWLSEPSADNIDYLDLLNPLAGLSSDVRLAAVVEYASQPLLYVIDGTPLAKAAVDWCAEVRCTLQVLSLRGDPAYLVLLRPGQVTLYPVGFQGREDSGVEWPAPEVGGRSLIQELIAETIPGLADVESRRLGVHKLLFDLLSDAADELLATRALKDNHDDVLALVGRALFARFVIDRQIMTAKTFLKLKGRLDDCFADAGRAALTCEWLDEKFNGELLSLPSADYHTTFASYGRDSATIFRALSNLVRRSPGGQTTFDNEWGDLDFAHVPVGLMSEVYERYAHLHVGKNAKKESMHYTPRHIAEFMVDQAFEGLDEKARHTAACLDPAAGGGVFLVLCMRRLVAEKWRSTRRRPTRKVIKQILYRQIRGFDINSSALKLAALGLYLTALELDPSPTDVEGLQFDPLFAPQPDASIQTVLTHTRFSDQPHPNPYVSGSLGHAVPIGHEGRYDIVIGNPPWTGLGRDGALVAKEMELMVRDVAGKIAERHPDRPEFREISNYYENPDAVPDLPFVWRSIEWARPGGVIAYALHARLLFKTSDKNLKARDALFSALRVTGILNGSAVRQENVWPNVDAQWCLFFARNEVSQAGDAFQFVNIELEKDLNARGRMRVDYQAAQPIQNDVLRHKPYLLKTLFRGTSMDCAVMDHLSSVAKMSIRDYMKVHGLNCGEGYRQTEGGAMDASAFIGMPDLRRDWAPRFFVQADEIPRFERTTLDRTRKMRIYKAPLLLVPAAMPFDLSEGYGLLADKDVFYSESFFGYSANGLEDSDPLGLAKYLYVLTYSALFRYHVLMTSSQFGVERDTLQKEDVDEFPLVPFESLSAQSIARIHKVADRIASGKCPWSKVDDLVYQIYTISSEHQSVINDTLAVSMPYGPSIDAANSPPSETQARAFASTMESYLEPLLQLAGIDISVEARPSRQGTWRSVDIKVGHSNAPNWESDWIRKLADDQGASRVFVVNPPNHIGIALLNQYRYWTPSRARLCALTVIREHSDDLIHLIA